MNSSKDRVLTRVLGIDKFGNIRLGESNDNTVTHNDLSMRIFNDIYSKIEISETDVYGEGIEKRWPIAAAVVVNYGYLISLEVHNMASALVYNFVLVPKQVTQEQYSEFKDRYGRRDDMVFIDLTNYIDRYFENEVGEVNFSSLCEHLERKMSNDKIVKLEFNRFFTKKKPECKDNEK